MSKLSKTKLKYEKLPSEDNKSFLKLLTSASAYANIKAYSINKRGNMSKKQSKTTNKKRNITPVITLVDILARSVAIAFLLEPFFMQEAMSLRVVMGLAIVWLTIGVAEFVYKMFVVPAAKAISEA